MDSTQASHDSSNKTINHNRRVAVTIGVLLLLAVAIAGGVLWWQKSQQTSLLPSGVTQRLSSFTLYFYNNKIPAGYSFDTAKIVTDGGVLMVPLSKNGGTPVVLTEQVMPTNLSSKDLQQNDSMHVTGAPGEAVVNNIEGRLVGATVTPSNPKVLILLNASGSTSKDDLTQLLQGLQPVK